MIDNRSTDGSLADAPESRLARLVSEITDRLHQKPDLEPSELAKIERDFPDEAESIRQLLPTLKAIAELDAHAPSVGSAMDGLSRMESPADSDCRLGDFRLLRELGRGGMGVVYEAEQISLKRRVALKVLPFAALLNERQLQRFRNEATAAAVLKHQNIVSVFCVGQDRGVHYYAMELVDGQSLAEVVTDQNSTIGAAAGNNQNIDVRFAARLAVQAADALDFAHQHGVIHRDIKPSNLLLGRAGRLCVADFGLARFQSASTEPLTRTGEFVGTLRYMSPEQLECGRIEDERTDIYSLGVTLYELVTLRHAFSGSSWQDLSQQITRGKTLSPRTINRAIPADLEIIIQKATATSPGDRYPNVAALKQDLERYLEHRPVRARPIGTLGRAARWAKRNPKTAMLAVALFVGMLLLSIGSGAVARRAVREADHQRRVVYAREIKLAKAAIEAGEFELAERTLARWKQEANLRNFEWDYLWTRCHNSAAHRSLSQKVAPYRVTYSQDGTKLAISDALGRRVRIFDARDGRELELLESPSAAVYLLGRIPNTNTLVVGDSRGQITMWDFDARASNPIDRFAIKTDDESLSIRNVSFSPDLKVVAAAVRMTPPPDSDNVPAEIRLFDRQSDTWSVLASGNSKQPVVEFARNGEQLITACDRDGLRIWNAADRTLAHQVPIDFGTVSAICVSPRGNTVVTVATTAKELTHECQLTFWDPSNWEPVFSTALHDDRYLSLTMSPDGTRLACGTESHAIHLFDTATYGRRVVESSHSAPLTALSFTPDGKFLASCGRDGKTRVWDVDDLTTLTTDDIVFDQHMGYVISARFIDSGRTVCSVDGTGRLIKWDAMTGDILQQKTFSPDHMNFATLTVSPDYRMLAVKQCNWPSVKKPARLTFYSLPNLERRRTVHLPLGSITTSGAFSSDTKTYVTICNDQLVSINVEEGSIIDQTKPVGKWIKAVAFTNDQTQLLCAGDAGTAHFFDAKTLLENGEPVRCDDGFTHTIDVSPNGRHYATGGVENIIRIWNVNTRKLVREFDPAPDFIIHLAYSPDGQRILSTDQRGVVRVWDTDTGEELLTLQVAKNWTVIGEFSADGRTILSGCENSVVVFRCADPDELDQLQSRTLPHLGCQ